MTRKSKQAGGNFPLTYYERTKKFASSEYGTTTQRLPGQSQYQIGTCALSLISLLDEPTALVSPSGYMYEKNAILEYLLSWTQRLKMEKQLQEEQELKSLQNSKNNNNVEEDERKRSLFEQAQSVVGSKRQKSDAEERQLQLQRDLKRTSYWLADSSSSSQAIAKSTMTKPPPAAASELALTTTTAAASSLKQEEEQQEQDERPRSPHSQQPLRRKDLWAVQLCREQDKLVCAISKKALVGDVMAYWVEKDKKKERGVVVLTSVYKELCGGRPPPQSTSSSSSSPSGNTDGSKKNPPRCPLTSQKIKEIRQLQKSGSSFASSGQVLQVKKYTPTIT